ncbi:DNA recombination and repair protein RecF [Chitinispirillum alkaliphilum]|nr:DNA recombination and repair protein RecF [Chitinispirillum alkaliphilum]
MHLDFLRLINFRNYRDLSLEIPCGGALFEGLNGSGKTNLLESIHLLCTGRSQRGAARKTMINHEEKSAFAEGCFNYEDGARVKASLGFDRDRRVSMKINDKPLGSFSEWFGERPVVSFGTDDLELVYGPPETRRRFLDMLISQIDRGYFEALARYRRSMLSRNSLMGKVWEPLQYEIYEEQMAQSGAELVFWRQRVVEELIPLLGDFYREISGGRESADLQYEPRCKIDCSSKKEWKNVFYSFLAQRRRRDIEVGFSSSGPHRDELRFLLDKRLARTFGSQGQCRSFVLSLKLASVLLIERHRHQSMIFLIDDAVSELDTGRTSRVYPLIEGKGQVFIATPRLDITLGKSVLNCVVSDGNVEVR